jgi:hypothetical protein
MGSQEEAKSCSGYCAWGLIVQAFEAQRGFDHSEVVHGCFLTVFQLLFFVYACLALFSHTLWVLRHIDNLCEVFVLNWARAQISPMLAKVPQMKGVEENFLGQIEHASFVLYRSPHGCVDWLIDSLHIKRHGISSRRQFYGEIFQDILVVFKPYVRKRTLIAIVTQEWYSVIGPSTF